jgi:catechol 2,3-dioxygenase-like lactoylglutathione lyase family enzyme
MNDKSTRGCLTLFSGMMAFFLFTLSNENTWAQPDAKPKIMNVPDSTDPTVSVRYIVSDVDSSISFYSGILGFHVVMHPAPEFAWLSRGNLRLLLSKPSGRGGGGQAMHDGAIPAPGGWNRFQIEVEDLEATVKELKSKNAKFRNEIVIGIGGKQILLEDPSGNLIELFQPTR